MVHSSSHREKPTKWSNLPSKAIRNISKRLQTRDQLVRFKLVCRKWKKCSILFPVNTLSLTLPFTIHAPNSSNILPFHSSTHPITLQVSSVYLITPHSQSDISLEPWMVMIEESNPGKLRLWHPLSAKRVKKIPTAALDMSKFRVQELVQGYSLENSDCVRKAILCSSTSTSLEVLVLCKGGILGKLTVRMRISQDHDSDSEEDEEDEKRICWKPFKRKKSMSSLDDIVEFKEKYCAVDNTGRLYEVDIKAMTVANVLISKSVYKTGEFVWHNQRLKRLVVDPTSRNLHLVVRERTNSKTKVNFTLYKFNEEGRKWVVVGDLGSDKLLFVGIKHCFFAKAKDFPRCKGNSILFAANCFPRYRGKGHAPDETLFKNNMDVEVGVHRLGEGDNFKLLSLAYYPEFSKSIWPPPTWFPSKRKDEMDTSSSSQEDSDDDKEEMLTDSSGESESSNGKAKDEAIARDSSRVSDNNGITGSDIDNEKQQRSLSNEHQDHDSEAHAFVTPLPIKFKSDDVGTSKTECQKNEKGSGTEFSKEKVCNSSNSSPVTPSANLPAFSTVKFEGVDIGSELLPTLETIQNKHGNLISKDTVYSKGLRAEALELVAKLVITLQNTTGNNLTDSKAYKIQSDLSDLQRVGLKVDWLVPAVEKTLKLQKHKPVIESIQRLNKRKAQIDEEEKQFLARITKAKQEVEQEMATIPSPEAINLDECLGSGLF